jgi:hypothetical protein
MPDGRFSQRLPGFLTHPPSGMDVWSEAGRTIETAHRTRLPNGWTSWTALVLVPVVTLCLLTL